MVSISWVGLLSPRSLQWMSRLGGVEPQEPGLQIQVGAVQVVNGTQYTADLLYHLLRESWEDQDKAQPGVNHIVPVEGGLRQCEPGVGILGPEWRQLHLGWWRGATCC